MTARDREPESGEPEPPRVAVARLLNRAEVSAAPLARIDAISIFDDEHYENYDHDLVSPRQRRRVVEALAAAGYRHRTGRVIEAPDSGRPVLFPRPAILGTDPSRAVETLLAAGEGTVLVTPTQALLVVLHRFDDAEAAAELEALVYEQPANLDKAQQWLRAAGRARRLQAIRPALERTQAEGTALRRAKRFVSRLPR